MRESWLNLVLSLNEMTPLLFRGAAYRQLDTLAISGGTCKIRRVFTLKEVCPSSIEEKVIIPKSGMPTCVRHVKRRPGHILPHEPRCPLRRFPHA